MGAGLPTKLRRMSDLSPEQLAQRDPLLSGVGWRVGRRPHRSPYTTLIGSDTWALELTEPEWQDLCQGLDQLHLDLTQIQDQLMEEEAITVEHQTERLTLIASGFPHHHQIFIQLHNGRRGEGQWSPEVIPELRRAIARYRQLEELG